MLKTTHNAGFFSCCSVRLFDIITFFNKNKTIPTIVDSSSQFYYYKTNENVDVTSEFFDISNDSLILFEKEVCCDMTNECYQFNNYHTVDYSSLSPFLTKYFTPSKKICDIRDELLEKYEIDPEKTIAVYYRGTDKYTETRLDSFESYGDKLAELLVGNEEHLKIIVQTDYTPFLNYMKDRFRQICVIQENSTSDLFCGIHNEKTKSENYYDIQYLYATFLILSKCKHLICSSANGSIWMMFFRTNSKNVIQSLNKRWLA